MPVNHENKHEFHRAQGDCVGIRRELGVKTGVELI